MTGEILSKPIAEDSIRFLLLKSLRENPSDLQLSFSVMRTLVVIKDLTQDEKHNENGKIYRGVQRTRFMTSSLPISQRAQSH